MSKAILVIDMPKACGDCQLMCWDDMEGTEIHPKKWIGCWLNKRETHGKKPKWCPLKEAPSYQDELTDYEYSIESYRVGWNACLKEILGDEDE